MEKINDKSEDNVFLTLRMQKQEREKIHRLSRRLGYLSTCEMIKTMVNCAWDNLTKNEKG